MLDLDAGQFMLEIGRVAENQLSFRDRIGCAALDVAEGGDGLRLPQVEIDIRLIGQSVGGILRPIATGRRRL